MIVGSDHTGLVWMRFFAQVCVALAMLVFLLTRLQDLSAYSFWYDEIWSLNAVRDGWSALLVTIQEDLVHPPLFYLLLKIWHGLWGESELAARLLSVSLSTLLILPVTAVCRRAGATWYVITAVILILAVNSYLIWYHQQVRMYALLSLLSMATVWSYLRVLEDADGRKALQLWILFGLLSIALIYTHYFGWLVLGTLLLCTLLLDSRLIGRHIVVFSVCALIFLPWLLMIMPVYFSRGGLESNIGWIEQPSIASLVWHFGKLHGELGIRGTTRIGLVLFSFPLVAWLIWRARRILGGSLDAVDRPIVVLAAVGLLPPIFALSLAMMLPQAPWGDRHLIISAVPYLVAVILAVSRLWGTKLSGVHISVLVLWAVFAFYQEGPPRANHVDFRILAEAAIQKQVKHLLTLERFVTLPMRYYSQTRYTVTEIPQDATLDNNDGWVVVRRGSGLTLQDAGLSEYCTVTWLASSASLDYTVSFGRLDCGSAQN